MDMRGTKRSVMEFSSLINALWRCKIRDVALQCGYRNRGVNHIVPGKHFLHQPATDGAKEPQLFMQATTGESSTDKPRRIDRMATHELPTAKNAERNDGRNNSRAKRCRSRFQKRDDVGSNVVHIHLFFGVLAGFLAHICGAIIFLWFHRRWIPSLEELRRMLTSLWREMIVTGGIAFYICA